MNLMEVIKLSRITQIKNQNYKLFKYNLLETIFPVKNKSGRPSLLKSVTATPPPLKYIHWLEC